MTSVHKEKIVSVGAGRMGRGIAHVFAFAGHPVTLIDFKPRPAADLARLATEARGEIETNLKFLASLGVLTERQVPRVLELIRIVGIDEAPQALAEAVLIYEGVPETKAAKADALGRIGQCAAPDAIVASTTSAILVTELQPFIARPERFLNAHFLNPAYLIPLVEVSPGPTTSEAVTKKLFALLESAGKVPVRCSASPGYIVPRLQSLLLSEAARMVHEGVATAEDIDTAIRNGWGPRYSIMGPIEFIDYGGLDTAFYACHYMAKALNSPRHAPPPELDALMKAGKRGLREGHGYYDWSKVDVPAYLRRRQEQFVGILRHLDRLPKPGVTDG